MGQTGASSARSNVSLDFRPRHVHYSNTDYAASEGGKMIRSQCCYYVVGILTVLMFCPVVTGSQADSFINDTVPAPSPDTIRSDAAAEEKMGLVKYDAAVSLDFQMRYHNTYNGLIRQCLENWDNLQADLMGQSVFESYSRLGQKSGKELGRKRIRKEERWIRCILDRVPPDPRLIGQETVPRRPR